MLVEEPKFQNSLEMVVHRLAPDGTSQEDLVQELLVHAWETERAFPDKTWKWYLRSCWFCLQKRLRHQRRTDPMLSLQPQHCEQWPSDGFDSDDECHAQFDCDDSFMSLLIAEDLTRVLYSRLRRTDLLVFSDLCEGWEVPEIAHRRHLHAQTVRTIRSRIKCQTRALGF